MIKLNIILKNPEYTEPDGRVTRIANEPVPVMVVDEATCEHQETVCEGCAPDWAQDWDIVNADLFTAEGVTTVDWEEWP